MNILEKFNIVPLNQLPGNNLPENKSGSLLPVILVSVGILVIGYFFYQALEKKRKTENHN